MKPAIPILLLALTGCSWLRREPCRDAETLTFLVAVEATTSEHIAYTQADAALTDAQAKIRLARDVEILDRIEIVRKRGQGKKP